MERRIVCFDLEGPLSPQDNASDLLTAIPRGRDFFSVISHYDDILALEERVDYEPGDTLALILPFLLLHGVKPSTIEEVSSRSTLVHGAQELIAKCHDSNIETYVISTSYEQHARQVGLRVGVPTDNIIATHVDELLWASSLSRSLRETLTEAEAHILHNYCRSDFKDEELSRKIVAYLDELYLHKLPELGLEPCNSAKVVGGRRKVWAAEDIARKVGLDLRRLVYVGDSITDVALFRFIDAAGGLAIAFNGNAFAIPPSTVAVGSTSLMALAPLLDAWYIGGTRAVKETATLRINSTQDAHYVWRPGSSETLTEATIKCHRTFRDTVRQDVAALG